MPPRNVYDFSHGQKAVVWLRVVYPLLFDHGFQTFRSNMDRRSCLQKIRRFAVYQHCFLPDESKEEMYTFISLAFCAQNM